MNKRSDKMLAFLTAQMHFLQANLIIAYGCVETRTW